jgi:hypothetical protein
MKFLAPVLCALGAGLFGSAHAQNETSSTQPLDAASAAASAPSRPLSVAPNTAPQTSRPQREPIAGPEGHWRWMVSPYALHYTHNPEHRPIWAVGFEKQRPSTYLQGLVFFSNSFGQESAYLYMGQRLRHFSPWEPLYVQWTAGLLYGYKHQYADKVPFNYKGFSPGIILQLGWQINREYAVAANLMGTSALGLMITKDLR